MFKRLRERIAEEATKFPVGQLNNNSGKQLTDTDSKASNANSTEDLITLSDSPSVLVPQTSSRQFSIADEDGSTSEQNTPQKTHNDAALILTSEKPSHNANQRSTASDLAFGGEYKPSRSSYVPQSDIESEREEPPTLNLESISKDQLLGIIEILKARVHKYKNKYSEVVKNYKEIRDEKLKIENMLIENQDKGLRRMAELREQCQLEQKAKAHLEANLRLLMEEKDSRISVLETQINLLKDGGKLNLRTDQDQDAPHSDVSSGDVSWDNGALVSDQSSLKEKMERLEHQSSQAKKTITSQTEQLSVLRKQTENLSNELEEKVKQLNEIQDQFKEQELLHETTLTGLKVRLDELQKKEEESVMFMAETKRNMHIELEIKEKQLKKVEGEAKEFQEKYESEMFKCIELQKKMDERVLKLQHQIQSTEKLLEEEKQNLMQELTRGKTAAITLMQQECDKKILRTEEEWRAKLQKAEAELESKSSLSQLHDENNKVFEMEEKLQLSDKEIKELKLVKQQLEKDNEILKTSLEALESAKSETRSEENLKGLKEKLENAEKNHLVQMDEMKIKVSFLEKEKLALKTEKTELLKSKEKLTDLKNIESTLNNELKSKEELKNNLQKYETINKDQLAKIHGFQETMKDKENMILKLKADIEAVNKDNSEKIEELKKKIRTLEVEREQLMMQAQERVSITEAKYREDIQTLEEKNRLLIEETSEMEKLKTNIEHLIKKNKETVTHLDVLKKENLHLKDEILKTDERLSEVQHRKQSSEAELIEKLQRLKDENSSLMGKTNHFESLKAEKEELNEKLKKAEQQMTSVKELESERDRLKQENTDLSKQLEAFKFDLRAFKEEYEALKEGENKVRLELDESNSDKQDLEAKMSESNSLFETEIHALKLENEKLAKHIGNLESLHSSSPDSSSVKEYVASVRAECEAAVKAKEEDMELKLKHLVRDFCVQMDVKDKDCDKMMSEVMEKSQDVEDKLLKEHRKEASELRQSLFEKECAIDDIREHYEEALQKKDKKIKEMQLSLKKVADGDGAFDDAPPILEEGSDWDDTWAVPDEGVDNEGPTNEGEPCKDHLQQIQSLQEEVTKCNSEIKELKILLRLSPPESMVNNNNRRESVQSIDVPEPTEFEYLKNIIYEYMMGKEPITLAKVIAAVLRFSDSQTQQVVRREESKHSMR